MKQEWLTIDGETLTQCSKEASGDIVIPDGVTAIGQHAFYNCGEIKTIKIPDSVIEIGTGAFALCSNLTEINIPEGVTAIGENPSYQSISEIDCYFFGVFYQCYSLESITIPEGVTFIGARSFCGCKKLSCVGLPKTVTSIGIEAFSNCENLKYINIPNAVTYIGDYAFWGCKSLSSLTLSNNLISIGNYAFAHCEKLQEIEINNNNQIDEEANGSIGYFAFSECHSFKNVRIPNSIKIIKNGAFCEQSKRTTLQLDSLIVPASVKKIEAQMDSFIIEKLEFEGDIPQIDYYTQYKITELHTNIPRSIVRTKYPKIFNAIEDMSKSRFGIPENCTEESINPGYIRVTRAIAFDNTRQDDEIIEINTKYIVAVEPYYDIDSYRSDNHNGSRIICAAGTHENIYKAIVYESEDIVKEKIRESLNKLSQDVGGIAGILDKLEILCLNKEKKL